MCFIKSVFQSWDRKPVRSHHCLVLKKINLSKDTFAFSFFPFLQRVSSQQQKLLSPTKKKTGPEALVGPGEKTLRVLTQEYSAAAHDSVIKLIYLTSGASGGKCKAPEHKTCFGKTAFSVWRINQNNKIKTNKTQAGS